ncbi:MAG: 4Fe-4S binding protein [Coriobacteriia bacterium]|nr:4Fe-4S binding protein [Coriobacteriia bacterium]MCL2750919.1 4Fe-4S binding protein [Coriobacteriia bacterium]
MALTYLKNVSTLALDTDKCSGCARCGEVCPHAVYTFASKKAHITHRDRCIECGACALNCPDNAITVNAGVGCAAAVITGWIKGTEPSCDCTDDSCC